MPSEEEIKQRMLQQRMQEQMQGAAIQQQMQQQQMEQMLKIITTQVLDAKARERLNNLKLVKPELATQLELYLAQLYKAGHLRGKITEQQMIAMLKKLGEKKDFRIRRR